MSLGDSVCNNSGETVVGACAGLVFTDHGDAEVFGYQWQVRSNARAGLPGTVLTWICKYEHWHFGIAPAAVGAVVVDPLPIVGKSLAGLAKGVLK